MAVAGDYMSAASFLGIAGLIAFFGYDGFMYSVGWLVAYLTVLLVVADYGGTWVTTLHRRCVRDLALRIKIWGLGGLGCNCPSTKCKLISRGLESRRLQGSRF